jgi:A/G-specific adenine glycosylase
VWGGLWAPPEFPTRAELLAALEPGAGESARDAAPLLHAFTHFDLLIHPVWARETLPAAVADDGDVLWYNAARPARVGLPAPIVQLLQDPP